MAEEFLQSVKGQMQRVKVDPDIPLLDVLRNDLDLNNFTYLKQRQIARQLRHSQLEENLGGVHARIQGVDLALIMHKLNHESVACTKRYLGITDDELQAVALILKL